MNADAYPEPLSESSMPGRVEKRDLSGGTDQAASRRGRRHRASSGYHQAREVFGQRRQFAGHRNVPVTPPESCAVIIARPGAMPATAAHATALASFRAAPRRHGWRNAALQHHVGTGIVNQRPGPSTARFSKSTVQNATAATREGASNHLDGLFGPVDPYSPLLPRRQRKHQCDGPATRSIAVTPAGRAARHPSGSRQVASGPILSAS